MFGLSTRNLPTHYPTDIQHLQGSPGVRNMSDDIIVFGKTKNEHDQNLNNVIQRLQESSLTLNKDKCLFGVSNLTFFGHGVSASGVGPEKS